MQQRKCNQWGGVAALMLGLLQYTGPALGQEVVQEMPASADQEEPPPPLENAGTHYNIRVGSGGVNFSAGLQLRYVDNVFLANTGRRNDFVISPEADFAAYFPMGVSNALVLDVGVAYYQYTKNTALNTSMPIISPNSQLAFNIQSGDFTFRPSEAFSYQENPVYETGGQFFNVENTGRLARFNNQVGLGVKWDLNNLVLDAGYYHENLWAKDSSFDSINHVSELGNADAMFTVSPTLSAGLESWGSFNTFANQPILNSWRVLGGPGVRWNPSPFIKTRLGGGYERIEYNSGAARAAAIQPENTFYFYASVEHELNQFISHALVGSHNNDLGFNAGNLAGYHLVYNLIWRPREQLTFSPMVSFNWYHEGFGTSAPGLYNERFTYILAGVAATYRLGEHWRTSLSWTYHLKDSETPGLGYDQNQAAWELIYAF